MKKTNSGCYVVDHAIEDPDWGIEYAEKFCKCDCDSCRHWYADRFLSDGRESFKMEWRDKMKVKELIKELESYNCPDAYIECRHGTLKYEIYDIFIDIKKEKCLIGLK